MKDGLKRLWKGKEKTRQKRKSGKNLVLGPIKEEVAESLNLNAKLKIIKRAWLGVVWSASVGRKVRGQNFTLRKTPNWEIPTSIGAMPPRG